MIKSYLYIVFIALVVVSCKKTPDDTPLEKISEVPELTDVTISSSAINEFADITFGINYIDGDGDLGTEDADEKSIFIIDNRDLSIIHEYHLQPLLPIGETAAIQGRLNVVLENIIVLDQSNASESATFRVFIFDRAGNQSNVITTSAVTITK